MYSQARRQEAGHRADALRASSASTRAHRTLSSVLAVCVMTRCTAEHITLSAQLLQTPGVECCMMSMQVILLQAVKRLQLRRSEASR